MRFKKTIKKLASQQVADTHLPEKSPFLSPEGQPAPELDRIKRQLRRRNLRLVLAAVAICLCLVLLFQFAAKPLLNLCFYNPEQRSFSQNVAFSDFEMGMKAFTELHFPGRAFSDAEIENTGIGRYRIDLIYPGWDGKVNDTLTAELVRGSLVLPYRFWQGAVTIPQRNFTRSAPDWQGQTSQEELTQELQESMAYLKTLPDYLLVQADLSLPEDRSMAELASLYNYYTSDSLHLIWAGIRNTEAAGQGLPQTGFNPSGLYPIQVESEAYPAFMLATEIEQNDGKADGAMYETHFQTLLRYLTDHPDFLKALGGDIDRAAGYEAILQYLQKNGIDTYGVTVIGSPGAVLNFCEKEGVEKIQITELTFRTN